VTCYTQPCKPCKVTYILQYLPQGDESSPRGRWGVCAPALPEVLTDICVRRSELLALLTSMTSKNVKFIWTDEHQKAFDNIKKMICREVMLTFLDFSKPFHIYTDASDKQLGAVITQDEKPIAFYSTKLSSAQQRYTTGEQELLSIVETLREFRNILLGYNIIVHTDHKKLRYAKSTSDRVKRWRLLIEEFGP
jgi:hypothetical protein